VPPLDLYFYYWSFLVIVCIVGEGCSWNVGTCASFYAAADGRLPDFCLRHLSLPSLSPYIIIIYLISFFKPFLSSFVWKTNIKLKHKSTFKWHYIISPNLWKQTMTISLHIWTKTNKDSVRLFLGCFDTRYRNDNEPHLVKYTGKTHRVSDNKKRGAVCIIHIYIVWQQLSLTRGVGFHKNHHIYM
jgi:hypothetical protein